MAIGGICAGRGRLPLLRSVRRLPRAACTCFEGDVELEGEVGRLEEVESILGDACGLACLVEVLRNHLQEAGLSRHAESGLEGGAEQRPLGDVGNDHLCNYLNLYFY